MDSRYALQYEDRPRLRAVDVFPVEVQKQRMICLRDPQQLAAESVVMSFPAFFIVSRMNGSESVREIQSAFYRQFGEMVHLEKIAELLHLLDEKRFMETPSFEAHRARQVEEFRQSPVRPAMHAGSGYEVEPEALRRQIDGFFAHPDGLGPGRGLPGTDCIRGLIAPHIDFHRGGPTYTWAYGCLPRETPHDLYVIFGTSHSYLAEPFCLTTKDFVTPLGTAVTDKDLAGRLVRCSSFDLLAGEWVHRGEHSIEFQVVFLQYLYPGKTVKILPILCGHLLDDSASPTAPAVSEKAVAFLKSLEHCVAESGLRVCYIAGADLAHMGPRFGDRDPVEPALLSWLKGADLQLLEKVERRQAGQFLEEIIAEEDKRRICGTSPIYALLSVCGASQGKLLRYNQAPDPEATQVVSFASMAFY